VVDGWERGGVVQSRGLVLARTAEEAVDVEVARVVEEGLAAECFGEGGLEGLTDGEMEGEEGVDFGGGVADSALEVEER